MLKMVFKVKSLLKQLQLKAAIQESTLALLQNQVSLLGRFLIKIDCFFLASFDQKSNLLYVVLIFIPDNCYQLTRNKRKYHRNYECVRSLSFDVPCQ